MALLCADKNFPQPVVEALRQIGHDVQTLQEIGKAGQGMLDEAILHDASSQNRRVLTYNRKHFIHLQQEQPDHAGIIVCTVDQNFQSLTNRIDATFRAKNQLLGQLIRVHRPNFQ